MSIRAKLKEIVNGRKFSKTFSKGTRAQQVLWEKAVLAATVADMVEVTESQPLPGGDTGVTLTAGTYSDAQLYFSKGVLLDDYHFEQLTNAVADGAGGVIITDPLMIAIQTAYVGSDSATGWTLYKGEYVR